MHVHLYVPHQLVPIVGSVNALRLGITPVVPVVSYSSNSLPKREELTEMLKAIKNTVVVHDIKHRYSFGTHSHKVGNQNNAVQEYLFVAY